MFLEGVDLLNFECELLLSAGCFVDMDFHGRLITCTVGTVGKRSVDMTPRIAYLSEALRVVSFLSTYCNYVHRFSRIRGS